MASSVRANATLRSGEFDVEKSHTSKIVDSKAGNLGTSVLDF